MANEKAIQKAVQSRTLTGMVPKKTMQDYIKIMGKEIAKALPTVMTPERFTHIVLSALSSTPKLQETTPQSFLGAMMQAAQLGLEPNTALGQAYLIPYYNGRTKQQECQFQIGYKGLIDLAYRSGDVTVIGARTVYENDDFTYAFGLEPELKHVPAKAQRGEPVCFYAMFRTREGGYGFDVMSVEEVRHHAQRYSKTHSNGPWQTNFEEMAKKTVLKRVLKYAPMKSDFMRALSADESIKSELSDDMYTVPSTMESEDYVVDVETGAVLDEKETQRAD